MTDCSSLSFDFPSCRKRRVAADFSGGEVTSNGGVLLLRQADRLSGLTASLARRLIDGRQKGAMARFRDIKTLQKFASVHASIHNHFNKDRHLNRRDIFKQTRAAPLAQWRQLAA